MISHDVRGHNGRGRDDLGCDDHGRDVRGHKFNLAWKNCLSVEYNIQRSQIDQGPSLVSAST